MLTLTERAQQQLKVGLADGDLASARLRVFIDHRCHCGKAHFSLALEEEPAPDDTTFEGGEIPFVVGLSAKLAFYPLERYRREAVEVLDVDPGATVLEIGCGTGLNFGYIEERIGPGGRLIALDYTPAMLEQAARRGNEN